mmetsp:Transcript_1467/g.3216  ORF Transcript_1467/g.3216 Transcript_1467/m.3216 type:complete len:359 (-) Transcript_1467:808-1884(-)
MALEGLRLEGTCGALQSRQCGREAGETPRSAVAVVRHHAARLLHAGLTPRKVDAGRHLARNPRAGESGGCQHAAVDALQRPLLLRHGVPERTLGPAFGTMCNTAAASELKRLSIAHQDRGESLVARNEEARQLSSQSRDSELLRLVAWCQATYRVGVMNLQGPEANAVLAPTEVDSVLTSTHIEAWGVCLPGEEHVWTRPKVPRRRVALVNLHRHGICMAILGGNLDAEGDCRRGGALEVELHRAGAGTHAPRVSAAHLIRPTQFNKSRGGVNSTCCRRAARTGRQGIWHGAGKHLRFMVAFVHAHVHTIATDSSRAAAALVSLTSPLRGLRVTEAVEVAPLVVAAPVLAVQLDGVVA